MEIPIPKSLQVFWEDWNLRFFILFSLFLQTFLILVAPFRKRSSNRVTISFIWCAYLLADWAANFCVGIISNSQGKAADPTKAAEESGDLLALWAPFLLLHLGGPDTITAFALEDNELWIRHLLGLILQLFAAFYVFFQSLPKNRFWIPILLLFIAGLIKYAERTRALYLASLERFRETMLTDPDPGPNYAKLMEEYASKKEAGLPTRIKILAEPNKETEDANIDVPEGDLDDNEVVLKAYRFFKTFRGLIVDLIFSFRDRNQSRNYFLLLSGKDAFRIIEVELNFIYDVLFTKVEVVHWLGGYILRFIAFVSVVAACALFTVTKKDHFDHFNVIVTYTLLVGAISLDFISLWMIIFSEWTVAALGKSWGSRTVISVNNFLAKKCPPSFYRKWSSSLATYSLINYCVDLPQKELNNKASYFSFQKYVDLIKVVFNLILECTGLDGFLEYFYYVDIEPFTDELRDFVFKELQSKSYIAESSETAKEICASRGDWTLRNYSCRDLLQWVDDVDYDESLLLWHIATELCYHKDKKKDEEENDKKKDEKKDKENDPEKLHLHRTFSKSLSDYMLYLLVKQPGMMSAVAGIGQIRFRDTCAEAKKFFARGELKKGKEAEDACKKILEVSTDVRPVAIKGDRSKSVLFEASILAKKLNDLDETTKLDKWEIMSKVWVELMSYAAINCRADTHAQQVSKGGELVTFVWLLMAHFGLGNQFQIKEGHARAKLIVGKNDEGQGSGIHESWQHAFNLGYQDMEEYVNFDNIWKLHGDRTATILPLTMCMVTSVKPCVLSSYGSLRIGLQGYSGKVQMEGTIHHVSVNQHKLKGKIVPGAVFVLQTMCFQRFPLKDVGYFRLVPQNVVMFIGIGGEIQNSNSTHWPRMNKVEQDQGSSM